VGRLGHRRPRRRIWYSGDTGFHLDLGTIGQRPEPFNLTLIEARQRGAHWADTHPGRKLAVEVHRLVRGKTIGACAQGPDPAGAPRMERAD